MMLHTTPMIFVIHTVLTQQASTGRGWLWVHRVAVILEVGFCVQYSHERGRQA